MKTSPLKTPSREEQESPERGTPGSASRGNYHRIYSEMLAAKFICRLPAHMDKINELEIQIRLELSRQVFEIL